MSISSYENHRTLADAVYLLPPRRRGRKVHVSTLHRWASVGCRGVVLETVQVGGTRCTSVEALGRFFEALAEAKAGARPIPSAVIPQARTPARRAADSEAAAIALERSGA